MPYNVEGKYRYKTISEAVTALTQVVALVGWTAISLTTPSVSVVSLSVKRQFENIVDARSWISQIASQVGFDGVSITQS